jgi:hypothetical protein
MIIIDNDATCNDDIEKFQKRLEQSKNAVLSSDKSYRSYEQYEDSGYDSHKLRTNDWYLQKAQNETRVKREREEAQKEKQKYTDFYKSK